MNLKNLTPLLIALSLPAAGYGDTQGEIDFEASYRIESNGSLIAQTEISLTKIKPSEYIYKSASKPRGFFSFLVNDKVEEKSQWIFHNQNIRPLSYLYYRYGGRKNKRVELSFDWGQMIVKNQVNDHQWQMKIQDGVIDKFSVNMAVRQQLRNGRNELSFMVADGGKLKLYSFTNVGTERIETLLGKFEAIKVERHRKGKEITQLWYVPALEYIPVKIRRIDRHGNVLDMLASSVTTNKKGR